MTLIFTKISDVKSDHFLGSEDWPGNIVNFGSLPI